MHLHGEYSTGKHEDSKMGRKIQMSTIPSGGHSFVSARLTAPSHMTASQRPISLMFSMSLWEEIALTGPHSVPSWHTHSISAFRGACLALLKAGTGGSAE